MSNNNVPPCRAWLTVDLAALKHNFKQIKAACPGLHARVVVKANAYGLGVRKAAETLKEAGAECFCVADYAEAKEILDLGLPVQILSGIFEFELPGAVADKVILPVNSLRTAEMISAEAVKQNVTAECHIKLDTGMGRIGILAEHARDMIREIRKLPNLNITGMFSHFPDAHDEAFCQRQVKRFNRVLDAMKKDGMDIPVLHIASSDSILNVPEAVQPPFTAVRPGLCMYGVSEDAVKKFGLKPVVSLHARLAGFRVLPAGSSVGYGRTCKLTRDTLTGTVALGYADGLPLSLSGNMEVIYKGRKCKVLGRISMDYTVISLDAFTTDELALGDAVTCIGQEGGLAVTPEDWAAAAESHPYEILTGIGSRVARIYV